MQPSGRFESPRVLLRQAAPCQLVAFSPDSRLVLTSSLDASVRLHEVSSAKQLAAYPQGQETVVSLSWFPSSKRFLVATHRQLSVYSTQYAGSEPFQRITPAHSYTYDAVVGPGGDSIISVGQDRKIAFARWGAAPGACCSLVGLWTGRIDCWLAGSATQLTPPTPQAGG